MPKVQNSVIKKIIKDKKKKQKRSNKGFKFIIKNFKTQYVAKNGSVYLENTKEVLKDGDLVADGVHSFYLGRHIIRNGDRNQKISRSLDPMNQFYHFNKELFDKNDIFVNENVTMSGCFKSNKVTLQRTMIPEIVNEVSGLPTFSSIKIFSKAIKIALRKLKITQQAKSLKEDMFLTSFKQNTFPGFIYKEYFNKNTKSEACVEAFKIADKRWDVISDAYQSKTKLDRNKIFPNTFVVGARNKREYFYEDEDVLSSRAVHMPEFHSELNSSTWIDQISNDIKLKEQGPIYIGNSIVKYERLVKDLGNSVNVVEGDWKRFDSRLYITNIIIGIAILRCYYDLEDEEIDYHFLALFDTIAIKDYYTPGGYINRMIHGLPSGVCSTSLLGSIINLVNLIHCTQDYDSKKIKFVVGGDDFLICLDNSIDISEILNNIQTRAEDIGQKFKILDLKNPKSSKILDRPSFFKYTIDRNEPVVFPTSVLERTFLPWNKKYNSYLKIFNFLKDLIPSLGSPRSFHLPFYYFYQDIFSKVFERQISLKEIYLEHLDTYKRVMSGEKILKKNNIHFYKIFPFSESHFDSPSINKKVDIFLSSKTKIIRLKILK